MGFWEKVQKLDRRYIFLLVAIGVIVPLIAPFGLRPRPTIHVQHIFDDIEKLGPEDGPVMICFDYSPATMPELQPMAKALIRHCFARGVKVIVFGGLFPQGVGLAQEAIETVAEEYGKVNGVDYVFLGYVPGASTVILRIGEGIKETFEKDYYGTPLDSLPMMENINTYDDIPLLVDLSGSAVPYWWVAYAGTRYGQRVAVGTTAVSAAQYYPYLQTGQFSGMLGGLKGAAEYETLLREHDYVKASVRDEATLGMDPQTVIHILIIVLIILGNIGYYITRARKQGG